MADQEETDPQRGSDSRDDDGSFLARWSRRKQADHLDQAQMPACGPEPVSGQDLSVDEAQQAPPQQELTDADMPPVESLDERSDYAAFMSPGISETLRKQALRRLFHLPGLHVPDGLDDYDEDFTQFAKLGNIITHEMKRALEREWRAADASDQDPRDVDSEADLEQDRVANDMGGDTRDSTLSDETTDNEKG